MASSRIVWCALVLCMSWVAFGSSPTSAREDGFKVIVHPTNAINVVDRGFLRAAFLKTAIRWGHDKRSLRPIDLPKEHPVRDQFTNDILAKTPAQIRTYWIQRIFSGTAVPPPEAESISAAVAYVLANPGAVAYIPATADAGGTKVVRVD